MRNTHSEIDAFLEEIHDAVQQQQLDADLRKARDELGGERCEMQATKQRRRGYYEAPLRRGTACAHRRIGFRDFGQDAPAALEIFHAFIGELLAARGAIEQTHAELLLERGER